MVFSSYSFLFLFFPVFFLTYFIIDPRYRNALILAASLVFYCIGEGERGWILPSLLLISYASGYLVGRWRETDKIRASLMLFLGIAGNIGFLIYFKYIGFLGESGDAVLTALGLGAMLPVIRVALPLGISFIAFQGVSYIIDVYRGDVKATSSLLEFSTYKAMFPQLVAGPIVRYVEIAPQMRDRRVGADDVMFGIGRFCRGLAKKVLIADVMAQTADAVFALPTRELGMGAAWLGVIAYTLQIYFDFSGYSDMAIGMGRMMGFTYPENFRHPYISRSIGEFWRRWHITLSSWFRDYVYIPLGGNRKGAARTYLNLVAVFALTGLWHGASWTFVIWGLWHGLFMLIERQSNPEGWRISEPLRYVYVLLVVMIGWTLFRADSAEVATRMLRAMFGLGDWGAFVMPIRALIDPVILATLAAGVALSLPIYRMAMDRLPAGWFVPVNVVGGAVLLALAGAKVLSGSYSPFLYFRF